VAEIDQVYYCEPCDKIYEKPFGRYGQCDCGRKGWKNITYEAHNIKVRSISFVGGDEVHKYGVDGYYNASLGKKFSNRYEAEKYAESQGLYRPTKGDLDRAEAINYETHQTMENQRQRYTEALTKYQGDKERAVGEAFSVDNMIKDGTLKENYNE
jgi:hypothetical protein